MSQWTEITELNQIPVLGSRMIRTKNEEIAVFRGSDDTVYAIRDSCPHQHAPLSQGIMHGHTVTCPLHSWKIDLTSGEAQAPDDGCVNVYPVKQENGKVYIQLDSEVK